MRNSAGVFLLVSGVFWILPVCAGGSTLDSPDIANPASNGTGSFENKQLYQADQDNLLYDIDVQSVSLLAAVDDCPRPVSGFHIRTIKIDPIYILQGGPWGYDEMNSLFDTFDPDAPRIFFPTMDYPIIEGSCISEFVNLRDLGHGEFSGPEYPDHCYPGIDSCGCEPATQEPADGDDDDDFATEITGCIYLSAGAHVIGVNSDDGTIIWIGGVEIGRTSEWKGASNEDFVFLVEEDGWYPLKARNLEGGGGASLELHEFIKTPKGWIRILLNDRAAGGSPVVACCVDVPSDFEPDGDVDFEDFAGFASAWLSKPGDAQWNPVYDIGAAADSVIDVLDLAVFAEYWLVGLER